MRAALKLAFLTIAFVSAAALAQIPPGISKLTNKVEDLKGQVLILRGFYEGANLRYAADGRLLDARPPASWAAAEVEVVSTKIKGHRLEIRGKRMGLAFKDSHFIPVDRLVWSKGKSEIESVIIEAELVRPDEPSAIEAARHVFLTDEDRVADLVPEYWVGILGKPTAATATTQESTPFGEANKPKGAFRVGAGVTAPRAVFSPDPEYSEAARRSRYQGTSVLWVIVGPDGIVHDVRIQRPAGLGLDEKAVEVVKGWRFQPATKNGEPVAVQVNIEVNFRLY